MNTRRQRGFNLFELMLGITVLGVLFGLGVPSFNRMMRNNRLAEQANSMVGVLSYARSEAMKRGFRVSVCPANGDVCSGGTDWNTGILLFTDDEGTTGDLDGDDKLLQSLPASTNGFVAGGAASPASITFQPNGAPPAGVTIDIYKSDCTGKDVRRITVANTGRIGLTKADCP
jgi:type IV fimbrial biogenesis protein FimT